MVTEICSHLDPDGLLALSMVNKQYRALLLAKSSARLWKAARDRFDLPDSTVGGFTEWQYAQLAYGKECQECGVVKVALADFGIRKRLCKTCRTSSMLRLDTKQFRRLDLHPLAKDCVIRPLHSPGQLKWISRAPYALLEDLEVHSEKLWDLERAANLGSEEGAWVESTSLGGRLIRQARFRSQYKETSDDEDLHHEPSRLAKNFVAARQPFLKLFNAEGIAMFNSAKSLRDKLRTRRVQQLSFADRMKQLDRADQIADRLLELDPTCGACIDSVSFSSHKLVKREEPLADAEWEHIKPAILKLVARIKKKQDRAAMHVRLQDRQRSLRPRYDKLKAALPPTAQPFVPLFIDFLLLSSVKALWHDEAVKLDDATWEEHLDDVKEELDQFRLDLALRAHELIVAAAHDPDEPAASDPGEDEPDLSDTFFALASSIVSCGIPDCHKNVSQTGAGPAPVAPSVQASAQASTQDARAAAVGSLESVLRHQHASHNGATFISATRLFDCEPRQPISLPLEVSCVMSALLDLAKLDPGTATADDLDAFTSIVRAYEWENSPKHQRFTAWRDPEKLWLDLLCAVKIEADRATKLSPPQSLDTPIIACTLHDSRDWNRLPIPPLARTIVAAAKGKAEARFVKREDDDDDVSDSSIEQDEGDKADSQELEEGEDELASDDSA